MTSLTETINYCLFGKQETNIDEASERFWILNGWTNPDNPMFKNVTATPYNTYNEAAQMIQKRYDSASGAIFRATFGRDRQGNMTGFWNIESSSRGSTVYFSWLADDKTAKKFRWVDSKGSVGKANGVDYL